MRKRAVSLLLTLALAFSLCVPAFAAGEKGFYMTGDDSGVLVVENGDCDITITLQKADTTALTNQTIDGKKVYLDTVKMTVKVDAPPAGNYMLMLSDGEALPTASTAIRYINQEVAPGSADVTFETVYPVLPSQTTTLTLWITSDNTTFGTSGVKSVSLGYYLAYILGDVDSDGVVGITDVTKLLRYLASLEDLNATQKAAANVDGNSTVGITDVTRLLRYLASLDTLAS